MTKSQTLYSIRLPRDISYMVYVLDDGDRVYAGYTHFESFDKFMKVESRIFDEKFQRWMDFLSRN